MHVKAMPFLEEPAYIVSPPEFEKTGVLRARALKD
jgi:hypothetical protein